MQISLADCAEVLYPMAARRRQTALLCVIQILNERNNRPAQSSCVLLGLPPLTLRPVLRALAHLLWHDKLPGLRWDSQSHPRAEGGGYATRIDSPLHPAGVPLSSRRSNAAEESFSMLLFTRTMPWGCQGTALLGGGFAPQDRPQSHDRSVPMGLLYCSARNTLADPPARLQPVAMTATESSSCFAEARSLGSLCFTCYFVEESANVTTVLSCFLFTCIREENHPGPYCYIRVQLYCLEAWERPLHSTPLRSPTLSRLHTARPPGITMATALAGQH